MILNYHPVDTFQKVHVDSNRFMFVRGPVGSGKSSGCIWHCVLNSMKQIPQDDGVRRSRYGIIRASYPALKSTVVKSWRLWFKNLINIVYDTPIRGEMKLPHPDGESEIHMELVFIALDREEDVNKLQSLELTGVHINETAEIPQGVHQMVKSRINRFPETTVGGAVEPFIICDYNSVDTEHWLYKIAEDVRPPKHSFYHQPSALLMVDPRDADPNVPLIDAEGNHYIINPKADNLGHYEVRATHDKPTPTAKWDKEVGAWWVPHLPADYYTDQVFGAEPDWINVMILNNYGQVRAGKPVYPEYKDAVHFSERPLKPINGVPIIIGLDLGLTPAAAFTQLSPTGQMLVFDELVTQDCSIQKFLEDILKPHIHNNYSQFNYELVIDPSGLITRSQNDAKAAEAYVRESGLPYHAATTNNVVKRREAVVYFLRKQDGFVVGPECKVLRKGFITGYCYEKKRLSIAVGNPQYKEKPEKNIYSHVHDATQYAALDHSEGRTTRRVKKLRRHFSEYNQTKETYIADAIAGY